MTEIRDESSMELLVIEKLQIVNMYHYSFGVNRVNL